MDKMVNNIKGSFDIQDLGEPDWLLGIRISRNRDMGTIHLSQPSFISTIAKCFGVSAGQQINSPMDTLNELRASSTVDDLIDVPYASLIGSLNYCSVTTQPDISFAVNKCAQFTLRPSVTHWEAAKRIVRYLMHTSEYGIRYRSEGKGVEGYAHNLAGYTDTDFAGDTSDRKSTTGWLFNFNGSPISWALKKQSHVSRSSMESKLVARLFGTMEGIWLIRLGKDFRHTFTPIPLFTDNQSFILFSKNDIGNNCTKHIDMHYHYTRNEVTARNVRLHYMPGITNPADILMKALSPHKHIHILNSLGICCA